MAAPEVRLGVTIDDPATCFRRIDNNDPTVTDSRHSRVRRSPSYGAAISSVWSVSQRDRKWSFHAHCILLGGAGHLRAICGHFRAPFEGEYCLDSANDRYHLRSSP
jgi:hypothetical protein